MQVTAVVVAYNREELLRESLAALAAQTRKPDRLVVVNNASTDNTQEVAEQALKDWGDYGRLINLTENTGGAGGFAVGIAAAMVQEDLDWIWVMDDDTVPLKNACEEALNAHERYRQTGPDHLAVMGSRVIWTDGADHPMNTPKAKIGSDELERDRANDAGAMDIRSISFVSAFLRASRVREVGLPLADYFLWNDDFEFSARMLRGARGIFVPLSVVMHKTKSKGSSDQDPGERFYVEVRNKLWVFRNSHALKRWERVAYRAATVRRWVRTYRASQDKNMLKECFARGVRDAYRDPPRPTADVLEGVGIPSDVMREIVLLSSQEQLR
jgi:rhamnopyranosyl-N-acetylglucosaminyl-diphospho-decaprenol beta-1,3/1,4-galactofuranosyltransferase